MEDNKNTLYHSPKSVEEVEQELEAYMNQPKAGKRRCVSLSGAVGKIRGQSRKKKRVEMILVPGCSVCSWRKCSDTGFLHAS